MASEVFLLRGITHKELLHKYTEKKTAYFWASPHKAWRPKSCGRGLTRGQLAFSLQSLSIACDDGHLSV